MGQYGCQNNVVLSGFPDFVSGSKSVILVLADIDVFVEHQDIESRRRLGKVDKEKSKKTIARFINRKNYKNVLSNKKS